MKNFRLRNIFVGHDGERLQANLTAMLIYDAGGKPGYALCLLEAASDPEEV